MIRRSRTPRTAARLDATRTAYRLREPAQGGFTLIELLVVITIIVIVSAVALPTVLPALSHRQVSEGARILQGALAGARDAAIRDNAPSGIRLIPDPAFPIQYTSITLPSGATQTQVDPTLPLVYNRIVPLSPAPDYTTGVVQFYQPGVYTSVPNQSSTTNVLILEELLATSSGVPNERTNWFWNIRIGDKIQINNAGPWYTVVGPMEIGPTGGNTDLFVNATAANYPSRIIPPATKTGLIPWEFLYLVNGRDDDGDGYVDNGWDGGVTSNYEIEQWLGADVGGLSSASYTAQRRPAPSSNAREVALPSNVVIDASTWDYPLPAAATTTTSAVSPSRERSRLPVNYFNGYVDIMVYPNGTVLPTTIYSSPSSFGVSSAFFHFWLAERSDVYAPTANAILATSPPYLPLPQIGGASSLFNGSVIKGEYRLVTLFTRTGQITTNETVPFDLANAGTASYDPGLPFYQAQQGVSGGQQ